MRSLLWTAKALTFTALCSAAAAQAHATSPVFAGTFNTTYLFTAKVLLGPPPPNFDTDPITVPGGYIVPEPILGGKVKGPFLNANITSGLATPRVYRNGTVQEPVIDLYGVTDDGVPLSLHETGIGSPSAQVTRLEIHIGCGKRYDALNTGFVLASVNPNAARTVVTVQAYLVENIAGS